MSDLATQSGLKPSVIEKIRSVFAGCSQIEQVLLYGSRAKGNFRPGSDIDLVIIGKQLSLTQLMKVANDLDELLLPFNIDISLIHDIENPDLIDHIQRIGLIFYPE